MSQRDVDIETLKSNGNFCYLASPYTNKSQKVMSARYLAASHAAASLMREGLSIYSPIAHGHPLSEYFNLPQCDWGFWEKQCMPILECCNAVLVLCLPGWDESRGIAAELRRAKEFRIPTFSVDIQGDEMAVYQSDFEVDLDREPRDCYIIGDPDEESH